MSASCDTKVELVSNVINGLFNQRLTAVHLEGTGGRTEAPQKILDLQLDKLD